jgi:hypothetical protein
MYEPLNAKCLEIRVFDLEHSQTYDSEIRGFLRIKPLVQDGRPHPEPFEALSYTWGSGGDLRNILINGISTPVGENLELFLRNRRHATETVTLWVDAICINQTDSDEKSSQIPLMSTIYLHAHSVTIWLGPAADDSELAMQVMNELGSGSPYEKMPVLQGQVLRAFNHLLNRPWWSRVWIIQEVVFGGIGEGVKKIRVRCGTEEIPWARLVIAAARMMAYRAFKRQYFPSISHILDLENLRENAFTLRKRMTRGFQSNGADTALSTWWALELVSRYRRFKATEPKDKVYALALMFTAKIPISLAPNYAAPLNNVYREFAEWSIRGMSDIEILKHCGGTSTRGLPSWVPDWSLDLGCLPLPSTKRSLRSEVPWWSDPVEDENEGTRGYYASPVHEDEAEQDEEARIRMKQLQIGSGGHVRLNDIREIPPNHPARKLIDELPEAMREIIAKPIRENNIVGMVLDTGTIPAIESNDYNKLSENLQKQTQKSVEQALKKTLLSSYTPGSFRSTGTTVANIDIQGDVLAVEGILWDTIGDIHEGFPPDIEARLESTTEFHVAVGECKAMAEDSKAAKRRHPSLEERIKAFWLTILTGQIPPEAMQTGQDLFSDYMTWLPPLPSSWTAKEPELTATTTGLLWYAEGTKVMNEALAKYEKIKNPNSSEPPFSIASSYKWDGLVPAEWTETDRQTYKAKFQQLGNLWKKQRYDLYHTPFETLNVVPDPYWHERQDKDDLAKRKAKRWARTDEWRPGPDERSQYFVQEAERVRMSHVSMVPYSMLENDIEEYTLGRRFFVTEKGYFGLAPKDAQVGDRIAILFGSDVPFILRQSKPLENRSGSKTSWKIIGEAYVNEIMRGEALDEMSRDKSTSTIYID